MLANPRLILVGLVVLTVISAIQCQDEGVTRDKRTAPLILGFVAKKFGYHLVNQNNIFGRPDEIVLRKINPNGLFRRTQTTTRPAVQAQQPFPQVQPIGTPQALPERRPFFNGQAPPFAQWSLQTVNPPPPATAAPTTPAPAPAPTQPTPPPAPMMAQLPQMIMDFLQAQQPQQPQTPQVPQQPQGTQAPQPPQQAMRKEFMVQQEAPQDSPASQEQDQPLPTPQELANRFDIGTFFPWFAPPQNPVVVQQPQAPVTMAPTPAPVPQTPGPVAPVQPAPQPTPQNPPTQPPPPPLAPMVQMPVNPTMPTQGLPQFPTLPPFPTLPLTPQQPATPAPSAPQTPQAPQSPQPTAPGNEIDLTAFQRRAPADDPNYFGNTQGQQVTYDVNAIDPRSKNFENFQFLTTNQAAAPTPSAQQFGEVEAPSNDNDLLLQGLLQLGQNRAQNIPSSAAPATTTTAASDVEEGQFDFINVPEEQRQFAVQAQPDQEQVNPTQAAIDMNSTPNAFDVNQLAEGQGQFQQYQQEQQQPTQQAFEQGGRNTFPQFPLNSRTPSARGKILNIEQLRPTQTVYQQTHNGFRSEVPSQRGSFQGHLPNYDVQVIKSLELNDQQREFPSSDNGYPGQYYLPPQQAIQRRHAQVNRGQSTSQMHFRSNDQHYSLQTNHRSNYY